MLTAGVDSGAAFTGTKKDDVFNSGETFLGLDSGKPVYDPNLNSLDELNGGDGKDTLNVVTQGAITSVPANISNIERINLKSAKDVEFDTTTYTDVETLNVTKATATAPGLTAADLTAAATTDVNVSGITTGAVSVNGGKNVNVNDDATASTITIGATTGATGTVTVKDAAQTGAIAVNGGTDVTITASGNNAAGETISVGQAPVAGSPLPTGAVKVTSTGSYTDGAADTTMGDIKIAGGSTVTVTQSAGITDAQKTAALTLTTNDTVIQGAVDVVGGAATTSVTVVQDADVTATIAAGSTTNEIGVTAGDVTIDDKNAGTTTAATIATVSVTNAGIVTVDSAALATLKLAGTITSVDTTLSPVTATGSATLALNTTGATTGVINLNTDTKTVNVTNSGTSTVANLTATGATALTVAGTGALTITDADLLKNVTSVNVTNTDSTNFASIAGSTQLNNNATFTAAGGSETVKVGATTKAISMGAGDDEVILVSGATALTGTIDGGAGSADRITFNDMADAVDATADNVFEGKISGFEELELTGNGVTTAAGTDIIDLGNLDNISKVIVSDDADNAFSIDNMANKGTLRIEANQTANINVIVKNAVVPTADVMNIELSSATALTNVDVTVANVETINVTTEDTAPTVGNIAHTLDLDAQAATKIVVTGNAGANFLTTSTFSTNLTSFDASAVTAGAVTYTSDALEKASTVKGGAGNDVINMAAATAAVVLSGNAGNDTLTGGEVADTINGGEGNDIIYGSEGADKLTGGAGADVFAVLTAIHSNGVNVDNITDFLSGTDKIGIQSNKAITYLGEASSYGTVLTAFNGTTAPEAVLDTSTKTLYIDVDGNKILNNLDIAIDLNVISLSQSDFATFTAAAGGVITLTDKQDTIYAVGVANIITDVFGTNAKITVTDTDNSLDTSDGDIFAGSFDVINGFDADNTGSGALDTLILAGITTATENGDVVTANLNTDEFQIIQGTWDAATNKFTADSSANGTDSLVAYNNGTADNAGIVLVGTIIDAGDIA